MIESIILLVLAIGGGLLVLSGRYSGWLQALPRKWPQLAALQAMRPQRSEEQRARIKRRGNIFAGIQLILLGLGMPVVYVASSIMAFSDPGRVGLGISGIIGFALMLLGIRTIWSSRRLPPRPNRDREFYERVTGRSWEPPERD